MYRYSSDYKVEAKNVDWISNRVWDTLDTVKDLIGKTQAQTSLLKGDVDELDENSEYVVEKLKIARDALKEANHQLGVISVRIQQRGEAELRKKML